MVLMGETVIFKAHEHQAIVKAVTDGSKQEEKRQKAEKEKKKITSLDRSIALQSDKSGSTLPKR